MPSFAGTEVNPSCGDSISFQGIINGDILEKIRFEGSGCVISQASASLLAEYLEGKPIQNAVQCTPEDMQKLIALDLGPTRIRCALLALEALHNGLKNR